MASIFYVHQKATYQHEHDGGFVWSPKTAMNGGQNIGFSNMTLIEPGDFILHHCDRRILSISKVISGYYSCEKPEYFRSGDWLKDGWRIDTKYYDLNTPFNVMPHAASLQCPPGARKGNAFTKNGDPTEFYMCVLEDEQAEFLLTKMLVNQTSKDVINTIVSALETLGVTGGLDDDSGSYANDDKIQKFWGSCSGNWNGRKKEQQTVQTGNGNRIIPHRDPQVSINALKYANNKCENDANHLTFKRKRIDIDYMESHHLIPISRYRDFQYSLDVEENVVCLCPTCHRLLHHGKMSEKEVLLKKLYDARNQALQQCGLTITFDKLKEYYK